MLPYLREHHADPGRVHSDGHITRVAVEEARERVATLVGARPREIVFTSGGTEAVNTAVYGSVSRRGRRRPARDDARRAFERARRLPARAIVDGGRRRRLARTVRRRTRYSTRSRPPPPSCRCSWRTTRSAPCNRSRRSVAAPASVGRSSTSTRAQPSATTASTSRSRRRSHERDRAHVGRAEGDRSARDPTRPPAPAPRRRRRAGAGPTRRDRERAGDRRFRRGRGGGGGVARHRGCDAFAAHRPVTPAPRRERPGSRPSRRRRADGWAPEPRLLRGSRRRGRTRVCSRSTSTASPCTRDRPVRPSRSNPRPYSRRCSADADHALRLSLGWSTTDADVDRVVEVLPGIIERLRGLRTA